VYGQGLGVVVDVAVVAIGYMFRYGSKSSSRFGIRMSVGLGKVNRHCLCLFQRTCP
jgi:hypothetical protein